MASNTKSTVKNAFIIRLRFDGYSEPFLNNNTTKKNPTLVLKQFQYQSFADW